MHNDTWESWYFAETHEEAEEWRREADRHSVEELELKWLVEELERESHNGGPPA